jgi:hypothetical protein
MQAWEEKYYEREEGREEGLTIGRSEGETLKIIAQIQKKVRKAKSLEDIADDLEERAEDISGIYEIVKENQDKTPEEILDIWKDEK